MPSAFQINTLARNAAANAIVDLIDDGAGNGRIEIRENGPPANIASASSGNLLGTLSFSSTAFGNASNGVASAAAISDDTNADNSGDAGYFRVYAGGGSDTAAIMQGSAGESVHTPDMVFDNRTIVQGGIIAINSFTVTMPAS